MAARAIWKAGIRIGDVTVPIKLYAGVEDRHIHFRLLHAEDLVPVKQQLVNPETGDVVEHADARRAIASATGDMVMLEPSELEGLEPAPSREIQVDRFVEPSALDHAWYDRPYYAGPDEASELYAALVKALRDTGRIGIARWVMRGKRYNGALRPEGEYLMSITLHSEQEMVPVSALQAPGGRKFGESELRMAEQLVETLTEAFDPHAYENEHRSRVMELIRAREAGEMVDFPRRQVREEPGEDLAAALKASLKRAKERRSA